MLDRVLEPEVMDSETEAVDYDSMDHSTVNRVFVTDFLAVWNRRSPILDVGTGTAQIPIEFCKQSAIGEIIAIDLAEHMLALGRENVRRAGFDDRIKLEKVNGREMSYASGSFASIISNSIVHHIPEPRFVIAEIVRVAAPGATIFIRDLLRPNDAPTLQHLVKTYAGDANAHQQKMFAESLHAALTLNEVRGLVAVHGFDADTVQQTTDRHWTWAAQKS
ncbi:MAG: class I SAM-dependent methyltransferase [Planctomycetes bacterium]|nr:class I SAM-dependent methyltransferase [Planctomycetota bacterium]